MKGYILLFLFLFLSGCTTQTQEIYPKTLQFNDHEHFPPYNITFYSESSKGELYSTIMNLPFFEHQFKEDQEYYKNAIFTIQENGSLSFYNYFNESLAFDFKSLPDNYTVYSVMNFSNFTSIVANSTDYRKWVLVDEETNEVYNFQTSANFSLTSSHDFKILENGNVMFLSYRVHNEEVPQWVYDEIKRQDFSLTVKLYPESLVIQEYTKEGVLVNEWDSYDYLSLEDSNFTYSAGFPFVRNELDGGVYDYVHGNSLFLDFDQNPIITSRHTNEIIKINWSSGDIIWRLGGKKSSFTFKNDSLNGFSHPHMGHRLDNGNILLFDNGNLHSPPQTRVVEYNLDETNNTATLVWSYSQDSFSPAFGSVQRLDNENTLIGWGRKSDSGKKITEIDKFGNLVMEIEFPLTVYNYRVYKFKE